MTEHAAVIFVFFFLAEYASIVLICILMSLLFLGGYQLYSINFVVLHVLLDYVWYFIVFIICAIQLITVYNINIFYNIYQWIITGDAKLLILFTYDFDIDILEYMPIKISHGYLFYIEGCLSYPLIEGILYGFALGLKTCILIFVFIWARASFPRIRFDQLMSFCWTILLPLIISFIIVIPCALHSFDTIATNVYLL